MESDRRHRARVHAALGDESRLAIVEELASSDRSPTELCRSLDIPSNLLAHHLDVMDEVGLIQRFGSSGDRRRRYVRLMHDPLDMLGITSARPAGTVLFVCTHNSARSQLAEALWRDRTGGPASSAGTHPADAVHPRAVAAAQRAGLDLSSATPRLLEPNITNAVVVTVCDRAHEELDPKPSWLHWSIPDPAATDTDHAFDSVIAHLDTRIAMLS